MIRFFSEDVPFKPSGIRRTRLWLEKVVRNHKREAGEISYIFCSDNYLLRMNRDFLQHDYFTDVITFEYNEGIAISGDIFISIERVRDNAKTMGIPVGDELNRVMVHGLLHLLGHKDKKPVDVGKMRAAEEECLRLLRRIR
jgi:probable rRNA maturation factor